MKDDILEQLDGVAAALENSARLWGFVSVVEDAATEIETLREEVADLMKQLEDVCGD